MDKQLLATFSCINLKGDYLSDPPNIHEVFRIVGDYIKVANDKMPQKSQSSYRADGAGIPVSFVVCKLNHHTAKETEMIKFINIENE